MLSSLNSCIFLLHFPLPLLRPLTTAKTSRHFEKKAKSNSHWSVTITSETAHLDNQNTGKSIVTWKFILIYNIHVFIFIPPLRACGAQFDAIDPFSLYVKITHFRSCDLKWFSFNWPFSQSCDLKWVNLHAS